ncbi:hypothetical protein [Nocardioides cavernaquae]|nr:hypothetical protein [Nocardioides cavernaquae]
MIERIALQAQWLNDPGRASAFSWSMSQFTDWDFADWDPDNSRRRRSL